MLEIYHFIQAHEEGGATTKLSMSLELLCSLLDTCISSKLVDFVRTISSTGRCDLVSCNDPDPHIEHTMYPSISATLSIFLDVHQRYILSLLRASLFKHHLSSLSSRPPSYLVAFLLQRAFPLPLSFTSEVGDKLMEVENFSMDQNHGTDATLGADDKCVSFLESSLPTCDFLSQANDLRIPLLMSEWKLLLKLVSGAICADKFKVDTKKKKKRILTLL